MAPPDDDGIRVHEDRRQGDLGGLVAAARRDARLSQTALADKVGLRLWEIERLERGEGDATTYLEQIARATGKPESWFLARDSRDAESDGAPAPVVSGGGLAEQRFPRLQGQRWGAHLVLASLSLLVVIRFFTEIVAVLPRAANFIDVPLLLVLLGAATVRRGQAARTDPLFLPALAFVAVCVASSVANLSRVEPGPALLFLYGFLGPLGFYYASSRLWPPGRASSLSRVLVVLGLVQFLVVLTIDLPRFRASGNPDDISGTFGENAYQLVFYLILLVALVAGIATFERGRPAARFAPAILVGCFSIIFLAQYRSLLVTTLVSVLIVAAFLSVARGRGERGLVVGAVGLALCVLALTFVASRFPIARFSSTLAAIRDEPTFFVSTRLQAAENVVRLYTDDPAFTVVGTGPGTYSSRAWRTFAQPASRSASNVAGPYVLAVTGGRIYRTDVSARYVLPQYESARSILGSKAPSVPFSSYTALLAEVGAFGFLLLVGIYVAALVKAGRTTLRSMRAAAPGDPLPALALACTVAFSVLLQMAFLENWLEVTRVTIPAWILLAVVSKEAQAHRPGADEGWRERR